MQAQDPPVLFIATWFASGNRYFCIKAGRLTQSPAPMVSWENGGISRYPPKLHEKPFRLVPGLDPSAVGPPPPHQ